MSWEFMSASVAGAAHEAVGKDCDDCCYVGLHSSGALIAIVADGVGSAARGGVGARHAVDAVRCSLQRAESVDTVETISVHLASAVNDAILSLRAMRDDTDLSELATTLSVMWVAEEFVASVHVGDGFGVVAHETEDGRRWRTLLRPQKGEYANETSVLTSATFQSGNATVVLERNVDAICLSTDGMLKLVLDYGDAPHAPFFDGMITTGRKIPRAKRDDKLAAYLAHHDVVSRTDDDKTLIIAWRNGEKR